MRLYLITMSLLFLCSLLVAQETLHTAENVTISIGDEPEEKTRETLIARRGDAAFTAGSYKKNTHVKSYDVNTLKLNWHKVYPSEVKVSGIDYDIYSSYFIGEKIVLIYSGYNKKTKQYQFIKRVLDQEGNEENLVVFCRFSANNKDDDVRFEIKQVLNDEYILLQATTNWKDNSKPIMAYFFWLDKDMNLLEEYKFNTSVNSQNAFIVDYAVNSKKDAFLLIDKNIIKRENKNYKGDMVLWKCSVGNETIEVDYNLGEQYINDANLSFNEVNNELVVQGFLGFEKRDRINGIYAQSFTPQLVEKEMKVLPVTQQLIKDWVGERRWAERMSRGDKLNLKYKESIPTPDGGTYVIYEDVQSLIYRDATNDYWAKDVFILYYDSSYDIKFYSVLPKMNMVTGEQSKHTITYGRKVVGSDLYIYMATRAGGVTKSYPDIESLRDRGASDVVLLECFVPSTGEVKVEDLYLYKASSKFFLVDPRDFKHNESTDDLFFTIGNGYSNKKYPVHLVKD
jgi:hypothetical protein